MKHFQTGEAAQTSGPSSERREARQRPLKLYRHPGRAARVDLSSGHFVLTLYVGQRPSAVRGAQLRFRSSQNIFFASSPAPARS
jgi:hypothetical protein